MATLGLFYY